MAEVTDASVLFMWRLVHLFFNPSSTFADANMVKYCVFVIIGSGVGYLK